MHRLRHYLLSPILALVCLAPLACAAEAPERISAAQFREDVAFVRKTIATAHPDLGFSTDAALIAARLDRLAWQLPLMLTRDDAWRRLATLNPVFADAHSFITWPDWRADIQAWLAAGGTLFPGDVEIGPDGKLFMRDGERTRIVSVNGVDAQALVSDLLDRVHGDTPVFRTNLLAERWWLFYWKTVGAPERYRLVLERAGRRQVVDLPGSRELPRLLREEDDFARQFKLDIQPGGKAVLTVGSFALADPAPFLAFTRDAFTRIRDAGVTTLEIDISRNGGGDDGLWLDGLMPYLATVPYRTGSVYRGRMRTPTGESPTVTDGEITTWRQPEADNPLRFGGKVIVRIGPGTYSSAILFANVMRDFGMATLSGSGGAARRAQTGGIRQFRLPHSGLVLWLPRFILHPPAGPAAGTLLETDGAPPQTAMR